MDLQTAKTQMLAQQIRAWEVLDERVLTAFRHVPRERFAPQDYEDLAFADTEIPIGHGQCMMAPKIEGRLLQSLDISPADEALEIGTGTGYLTACLAALADRVTSVDLFPDFIASAGRRLENLGIDNVDLDTADATELSYDGRFDVIAITASVPALDRRLIRMLRPNGRLFVVVGRMPIMEARVITLHDGGDWAERSLFETVLTPMLNIDETEPFVL